MTETGTEHGSRRKSALSADRAWIVLDSQTPLEEPHGAGKG